MKHFHVGAKIHILSKNSHIENRNFYKIHFSEISFFAKFTFLKSRFSHNSHFWNLNFHKIHNSLISFFTQFTSLKYNIFKFKDIFVQKVVICSSVYFLSWKRILDIFYLRKFCWSWYCEVQRNAKFRKKASKTKFHWVGTISGRPTNSTCPESLLRKYFVRTKKTSYQCQGRQLFKKEEQTQHSVWKLLKNSHFGERSKLR